MTVMYVFYIVGFFLLMFVSFSPTARQTIDARDERYAVLAAQMTVLHWAAVAQCAETPCASGDVTVPTTSSRLPEIMRGAPAVTGGLIRSYSNGAGIVATVYTPSGTAGTIPEGTLGQALSRKAESVYTAGQWYAATGRIGMTTAGGATGMTAVGQPTTFSPGLAVPAVIGGYALRDGQPLIATNLNP